MNTCDGHLDRSSPLEWMLLLASSSLESLLVGLVEPVLAAVDEFGIGAGAQLQAP